MIDYTLVTEKKSYDDWLASRREAGKSDVISEMAEILTPVFLYLADGYKGGRRGTSLHHRAFALLYVLRPDLIDGEGLDCAAQRLKTNAPRLSMTVKKLLRGLPWLLERDASGLLRGVGAPRTRSDRYRSGELPQAQASLIGPRSGRCWRSEPGIARSATRRAPARACRVQREVPRP